MFQNDHIRVSIPVVSISLFVKQNYSTQLEKNKDETEKWIKINE